MMNNNNMSLWQKFLDIKTGNISICNGITVNPETVLGTFIASARKIIRINIINIPYRSYIISLNGFDFYLYFYANKIFRVTIAVVPYKNSTFSAIKKMFGKDAASSEYSFAWGSVAACDNKIDGLGTINVFYRYENSSANILFPPILLIPEAQNHDAQMLFNGSLKNNISRIGTIPDSTDPQWMIPEWLNWCNGPICKTCGKEMAFYSRLMLPPIVEDKKYIDTFLCQNCGEVASVIQE